MPSSLVVALHKSHFVLLLISDFLTLHRHDCSQFFSGFLRTPALLIRRFFLFRVNFLGTKYLLASHAGDADSQRATCED